MAAEDTPVQDGVPDIDSTQNDKNDPITPIVERRANPGFRPVPPPAKPKGFVRQALMEENGETPSSARLIAAFIFGSLTCLTFLIILVLLFRIMTIQDPMLGTALLSSLTKITLYWFLFFAATALSLYGINVWKYVAGMRLGFDNSLDQLGGGMGQMNQMNRFGGGGMGGYGGGMGGASPYAASPGASPAPSSSGLAQGTPAAARYRRTAAGGPATISKDDPLPSKTDEN